MTIAANNNFIAAPRMTPSQIAKAGAFCLFDLLLIGLFTQPGVPPPIVNLALLVSFIYAALLASEVCHSAGYISEGVKQGIQSRAYARVMAFRPMPPMIISAFSVGMILSLSVFSFCYGGVIGIISAGLYLYTGFTSAAIYVQRMHYHAFPERQAGYDRQTASFNPNSKKTQGNDVLGSKSHSRGVGNSSGSDC